MIFFCSWDDLQIPLQYPTLFPPQGDTGKLLKAALVELKWENRDILAEADGPSVYLTEDPGLSALTQESTDQEGSHTPNFPRHGVRQGFWLVLKPGMV